MVFNGKSISRVLKECVQSLVDAALDQKQIFGLLRQGEGRVVITGERLQHYYVSFEVYKVELNGIWGWRSHCDVKIMAFWNMPCSWIDKYHHPFFCLEDGGLKCSLAKSLWGFIWLRWGPLASFLNTVIILFRLYRSFKVKNEWSWLHSSMCLHGMDKDNSNILKVL